GARASRGSRSCSPPALSTAASRGSPSTSPSSRSSTTAARPSSARACGSRPRGRMRMGCRARAGRPRSVRRPRAAARSTCGARSSASTYPSSTSRLLLYDSPVSGNCYKVRLLLAHLGLSFERRIVDVVDRSNRPELLGDLNPALRVPTLILDDGRPLAESGAILWYFGEGTPFVPEDRYERAQVLQWMFFEQYDHEPAIAVVRFWVAYSGRADAFADRLEERTAAGHRALGAMERHLVGRDWLVGSGVTLADIALYAYTHVAPEGGFDLEPYPAIRAWLGRVAAEPGHVPIDA